MWRLEVFEQSCGVESCTVTVVSQHIRAKLTSGFCRKRELNGETGARMDLSKVSTTLSYFQCQQEEEKDA